MHVKTLKKFALLGIACCCVTSLTLPAENTLHSCIHKLTHTAHASVSKLLKTDAAYQNPAPHDAQTGASHCPKKITPVSFNVLTQHAAPLAQEFLTIAALTLLIETPHILKILFPNPEKMDVGTVETISPEHQRLFEQVCVKLAVDPRTLTIKQCSNLKKKYHTAALGTGTSLILFDKEEIDLPPQKLSFVMAHEVAHIKNNDVPKKLALSFISSTASVFLSYKPLQKLLQGPSTILAKTCGLAGFYFFSHWLAKTSNNHYSRYQEKRADIAAITALANKQGALDLFNRYQQENLIERQNLVWQGFTPEEIDIDDTGNKLSDTQHPPLSERIAYINAAIIL